MNARRHDPNRGGVKIRQTLVMFAGQNSSGPIFYRPHRFGHAKNTTNRRGHRGADQICRDQDIIGTHFAPSVDRAGEQFVRIQRNVHEEVGQQSGGDIDRASSVDRFAGVTAHTQARERLDGVADVSICQREVDAALTGIPGATTCQTAARRILVSPEARGQQQQTSERQAREIRNVVSDASRRERDSRRRGSGGQAFAHSFPSLIRHNVPPIARTTPPRPGSSCAAWIV